MRLFLAVIFLLALQCTSSHAAEDINALAYWNIYDINDSSISLNNDIHPYTLRTPLFTDYAWKWRAFRLPQGKQLKISQTGNFVYPEGTLLIKTFYYPISDSLAGTASLKEQPPEWILSLKKSLFKPIETRLLHLNNGKWQTYLYLWNKEATSASLLREGVAIPLKANYESTSQMVAFEYQVPSVQQCSECHGGNSTINAVSPLGPSFSQTNIRLTNPISTDNQISLWKKLELIDTASTEITETEVNQAREYLHVNCAHCHNPFGTANSSRLFLDRHQTDLRHLGVCKPSVAAGRGTLGLIYDIVPGSPEKSILLQRMESQDSDVRMPEIGRILIHQQGAAHIEHWIASMKTAKTPCSN